MNAEFDDLAADAQVPAEEAFGSTEHGDHVLRLAINGARSSSVIVATRPATTAFPRWVPPDVMAAARALTEDEALAQLPDWLHDVVVRGGR